MIMGADTVKQVNPNPLKTLANALGDLEEARRLYRASAEAAGRGRGKDEARGWFPRGSPGPRENNYFA